MRIVILTYGSRGDVQPYVALGVGLQRAGYEVRLTAPALFEDLVRGNGLDFAALPGDPAQLARDLAETAGDNLLRIMQAITEHALPVALEVLATVEEACRDADAVIHSFMMTQAGHEVARARGIRDFAAHLYPIFTPTTSYPNLMFPELPLGPAYNRLTHVIFTQSFWQGSRLAYGWLRRGRPDLKPLSGWPFDDASHAPPLLFGFSPAVIPPAPEWGRHVHVTGYWFLDEQPGWEPPANLAAFLEDGPPPVYVGFGSMIADEMERLASIAVEALTRAGQRGVLLTGWGGLTQRDLPDTVLKIDGVPHSWLFPRMAAVVHHGGAGTTAAGLRAGIPAVLVPFTADQPFWGRRVVALGVGPEPIPRRRLTAERLAYAIRIAATHRPMRERAAALGARIRAEDGVGRVAALMNGYLQPEARPTGYLASSEEL